MTLPGSNSALRDGLFKDADGQSCLPNYCRREMRSEMWGRTFFSVLHTSGAEHKQCMQLVFGSDPISKVEVKLWRVVFY